MPLTTKQRRILSEIDVIASRAGQDHWNIENYEKDARTPKSDLMKRQLIIGEVITTYIYVDELLSVVICNAFFSKTTFKKLWRTKKFKAFAYHVLENLYPLQKMRLVHDLREVPRDLRDSIERLNAVRNALAHSFFPENRRSYRQHGKVVYRDKDVFSVAGFEAFARDRDELIRYLIHRAFGIRPDY